MESFEAGGLTIIMKSHALRPIRIDFLDHSKSPGPICIKKVRENDYVINLDGQHKMFHANMLDKS